MRTNAHMAIKKTVNDAKRVNLYLSKDTVSEANQIIARNGLRSMSELIRFLVCEESKRKLGRSYKARRAL